MPKFSDAQRGEIGRKYEENMRLMASLSDSFAKASPALMPGAPSFDEATRNALKQIQDSMASIGTLQEAASRAAAEVQRSYDQTGTLDEAAQRALDQTRAYYEKIGTFQEAAARAYKTVIENSRKVGFASGTAFAGAFRKAHKPVPEGCEQAGALIDAFAELSLDFQASVADKMFAPPPSPGEGSDVEDQQTDYQQQVNDLMEKYAGDLDRIKEVADALAGLPPAESPGETEPSQAATKWHIECTTVVDLIYSAPPTFDVQNMDPNAAPADAQAATEPAPEQPGQGLSGPLATLAAMVPGAAPKGTPGSVTGAINATFDLRVKHLAADTAGVTPAGSWHGGLSATVSATSTTRLSNGEMEFIAYDKCDSDDGTVTFQLELMGEPTPDITPSQAYYQGAGSLTLAYEAGGEYTLGPRKGKRAPKWSTSVFIPIRIEVADGNVTITMAGGTTSGSISGRMLGVVSP